MTFKCRVATTKVLGAEAPFPIKTRIVAHSPRGTQLILKIVGEETEYYLVSLVEVTAGIYQFENKTKVALPNDNQKKI